MCWLTPPTTDLNVTSDAYARIFDNLHVCSLKNVSWIKKFEFILVIKKKKSTAFTVTQISTSRRLLSDVSIWRRQRLCISLPLPLLQGFPLSLLSGQTAKELPHFPLSLGISETHDEYNIRGFSQKLFFSSCFGLILYVIIPHLFMTSLSFSLARKRESFLISLRAPLNSFLYLCCSRSFSLSSLVLPRFFP